MTEEEAGVTNNFIDALKSEPCALAIIAALVICYLIIRNNNKHLEKMEEIRMKQYKELKGGNNGN